ncbi:unnamed protein product [Penicillium roqueforti FM164]|uniref:Uncharacterized protein n=1 Tax=Penicillium roqueforti (strain FM164) TaxID=1365484 RepID=W6QIS7_PENRF|nr:unnamed protein product [Penicillium roqueforti FM164]
MQYTVPNTPFQNGKEKSISFTFQHATCPTSYTSISKTWRKAPGSTSIQLPSTLDQPERRDPSFGAQFQLRDNYRCVITGQLSTDQWEHEGEPVVTCSIYGGLYIGGTQQK